VSTYHGAALQSFLDNDNETRNQMSEKRKQKNRQTGNGSILMFGRMKKTKKKKTEKRCQGILTYIHTNERRFLKAQRKQNVCFVFFVFFSVYQVGGGRTAFTLAVYSLDWQRGSPPVGRENFLRSVGGPKRNTGVGDGAGHINATTIVYVFR